MAERFETAHSHNRLRKMYRLELAESRLEAIRLAKKILQAAELENGHVSKDVMAVMAEILKDAREGLNKQIRHSRRSAGDGIPSSELKEALEELENDSTGGT